MNKLRERLRNNRGAQIIESTFVYPIMFFVIFFLIFMGNMFFVRARIDSLVTREAIRGAAEYADPNLSSFEDDIPTTNNDAKVTQNLYRYIDVIDLEGIQENEDTGDLESRLGESIGYYQDIRAENIEVTKHRVHNYVIYQTYEVEVTYDLKVPIKYLFSDDYLSLDMTAHVEVPVTDTSEFIRNVDMAVDYTERSKTGQEFLEKTNDLYAKVDEFVNGRDASDPDDGDAASGGAPGEGMPNGPRYGEQKITDAEYANLRKHTPTKAIRDMVNKGITIPMPDPVLEGMTITSKLEADHIVSMKNIVRMDGFEKLTYEQQLEVLNNPINFIGLSKAANASKQDKSYEEWTHYKKGTNEEIEVNKAFREEMIEKEKVIAAELQKQIDELNK